MDPKPYMSVCPLVRWLVHWSVRYMFFLKKPRLGSLTANNPWNTIEPLGKQKIIPPFGRIFVLTNLFFLKIEQHFYWVTSQINTFSRNILAMILVHAPFGIFSSYWVESCFSMENTAFNRNKKTIFCQIFQIVCPSVYTFVPQCHPARSEAQPTRCDAQPS